jgi:hypothetical protein
VDLIGEGNNNDKLNIKKRYWITEEDEKLKNLVD